MAKDSTVLIEMPISGEVPATEFGLHIDARLTPKQSTVLRRIANQLDKGQARLENGKRIVNATDAVKFMLEQAADSLLQKV